MDQMNQQSTAGAGNQQNWATPPVTPAPAAASHSSVYLWIVVILGLVAAAGLWWYYQQTIIEIDESGAGLMERGTVSNKAAAPADTDSAADIEADLQTTDLDNLDQELNSISSELSQ